ncbi:Uncharacterised protein [Vibrio cholerae]|nr:Uncharacterised protein [Vibrio cholerae]
MPRLTVPIHQFPARSCSASVTTSFSSGTNNDWKPSSVLIQTP